MDSSLVGYVQASRQDPFHFGPPCYLAAPALLGHFTLTVLQRYTSWSAVPWIRKLGVKGQTGEVLWISAPQVLGHDLLGLFALVSAGC